MCTKDLFEVTCHKEDCKNYDETYIYNCKCFTRLIQRTGDSNE